MTHVNTPVDGDEDVGQSVPRQIAPTSRGITPRSSSMATPAFASPATLSPARLSPIPADNPPEPASFQLDASVFVAGEPISSPAIRVEEPVLRHALRTSPMDADVSGLLEKCLVTKQVLAAEVVHPLPSAAMEDDERRSEPEHRVIAGKVKKTVISRSLGKQLLKPTKRRTRDNEIALSVAPHATLPEETAPNEKRPVEDPPLEAQGSSALKKAKTKTKRKRGDEIDAIFDGL
jgi:hypothetical protein